jgi:sulfate permease, SulP family
MHNLARFLPFLAWFPMSRDTLKADVIAGITVALVLVPQSMAYAQLAGLPAHYGLYAAFLPPLIASMFGSSRQLATGPVAMVSLMTATALEPLASQGSAQFLAYAMALALIVGLFQLTLGLLRLGVVVDLLSHPVVVGFTNAGALIIATSQLNKVFGVSKGAGEHHYESVINTVRAALEHTHLPTLYMALSALGIMLVAKRINPRLPSVLIAVVVTTLLAWGTGYQEAGGQVVGKIPEGLPGLTFKGFDLGVISQLAMSALIICLVGFMEAIAVAKAMAAKTKQRLDANQELVGQGLSNIVAGLFYGYPVSGSFSRSAVNISAGAVSGFSSVVTGAMVGLTLLALTPLLYHLPQATLASVIILAVFNLIKFGPIKHAWRAQKHDGIVAMITFFLTLYIAPHIEKGILVGVVLSMILFIVRVMRPRVAELSWNEVDGTMRDVQVFTHLKTSPKLSLIRFDGSLFFGNASYFEDKVLKALASKPELKFIILDAEGINQVDSTGEEVLYHVVERLRENGVDLVVARMKKQFMDVMRNTKAIDFIGEQHFFSRVQYALDYCWDALGDSYDRSQCPLRRR